MILQCKISSREVRAVFCSGGFCRCTLCRSVSLFKYEVNSLVHLSSLKMCHWGSASPCTFPQYSHQSTESSPGMRSCWDQRSHHRLPMKGIMRFSPSLVDFQSSRGLVKTQDRQSRYRLSHRATFVNLYLFAALHKFGNLSMLTESNQLMNKTLMSDVDKQHKHKYKIDVRCPPPPLAWTMLERLMTSWRISSHASVAPTCWSL